MIRPIISLSRAEWLTGLTLAILSFFAASLLIAGYPQGLTPEQYVPFSYEGDGIAYLWNIQRAIEGVWYFENDRAGFPFGSNHLDYPTSDTGTYLIIKLLGWIFTSPVSVMNLYYLLGFSACAFTAYLVSRTLNVSRPFSMVVALVYSFSSFHFWRIGHLYFTWYFVAPLFFYFGFKLFSEHLVFTDPKQGIKRKIFSAAGLIFIASFGIYYSFFGCIVIAVCTVLSATIQRSWRHLIEGGLTLGCVILGVLMNVAPSLYYIFTEGENREGVNRLAAESELYALKITQMLLPRADHRLDSFFEFASRYNGTFPLITENMSASLGLLGSVGFLLLIASLLLYVIPTSQATFTNQRNEMSCFYSLQFRLRVLATLTFAMVLLGTVGGGSSLFAMLVSTSIRSWNRISIFIAFISVLALILCVDFLLTKYIKPIYSKISGVLLALTLLILGLYDQTTKPCHECMAANQKLMANDSSFIQTIEASLPSKAAVYQLPYMAYPESNPVNSLGSYDQARGLLHSTDLRWSFGGMRGRTGDWFYRKLAQLPIAQQMTIVKAMGFSGVYLDRRGYLATGSDSRCSLFINNKIERIKHDCMTIAEVENDIDTALGAQLSKLRMVSKDQHLTFTPIKVLDNAMLNASEQHQADLVLANSYLKPIGFMLVDGIPKQTEGGYEAPLDFRKDSLDFPHYVGSVTGLSGFTSVDGATVGRFSDAMEAKLITVWLSKPLPKKFTLTLRAEASGPNVGKPLKIKVGQQIQEVVLDEKFSTHTVIFETSKPAYKIEFKPYEPFSPARRWRAADRRFVAVHFQQLEIKPID